MLLTYLIFLFIAIIFKLFHFPGTGLIFIFSPAFLIIDVIVQSIRRHGDKETRILSAVGALILSIYLLFKFLYWSGSHLLFWIALVIPIIYLFRIVQKKVGYNFRFFLTSILLLFAIFNSTLSRSSFRQFYLLEDPFNKSDTIPHFYIQNLAYEFYLEGEYEKATKLITRNINHLNDLIAEGNTEKYITDIDLDNLEQSKMDLKNIKNLTWTELTPLIHEDRHLE